MCLDMFLNDASLPYQYLGDSQAENYEKYKHIASLENTLKTKDEELEQLRNTLKTKDEQHEQLLNTLKTKDEQLEQLRKFNNSLINCGLMAQSSFPQCSQFVRAPQFVPQGPNQFSYHHSSRVVRAPIVTSIGDLPSSLRAARPTPYDQTRGPPSYS